MKRILITAALTGANVALTGAANIGVTILTDKYIKNGKSKKSRKRNKLLKTAIVSGATACTALSGAAVSSSIINAGSGHHSTTPTSNNTEDATPAEKTE